MNKILLFLLLVSLNSIVHAVGCYGRVFNPVTDLNWNNSFPITAGGVKVTKSGPNNPPLHSMPAVCNCSLKPGVGVSYWEPRYLAEIARSAGCLMTLGGQASMGSSLAHMNSSGKSTSQTSDKARMQVHWYRYPVMAMMDVMSAYAGCATDMSFNLANMTEVDPDWNDDTYSVLSQAETLLFANQLAALSCLPEVATSMLNFPLDPMYWCSGAQGTIFPLTGTSQNFTNPAKGNLHILAKYMARSFRTGSLLASIGPWAKCGPILSPIWIKSQFRIEHVYPRHVNTTIVFGKPEVAFALPGANTPQQTSSAYMIWMGKQCCSAPY